MCNLVSVFSFFECLQNCFLHFVRLPLSGDTNLNRVRFSHIQESDMLIDRATKDCKNLNIFLFNARSAKMKYGLFTEFLTNLTQ